MIRLATPSDCSNLAVLSTQVWLDTYAKEGIKRQYSEFVLSNFTVEYFQQLVSHTDYRLWLCEQDDVLQGFVLVNLKSHCQCDRYTAGYDQVAVSDVSYEVEKLYVSSRHQGQGIGKRLLAMVEQELAKPYWLYTWVENDANNFYRHLGFALVGQLAFEFSGHSIHNHVYVKYP